ncbi:unnamed protein product [marine sediment metagenome]|uniref:Transposase n=1 Tax=marine sediment metagenome TaxID=412755 RepID=X1EWP9_9ZZZZ
MPLYKRVIICDCGNEIDRDKNSTINIMSRFLSRMPSGQAISNLLIICEKQACQFRQCTRMKPFAKAEGSSLCNKIETWLF